VTFIEFVFRDLWTFVGTVVLLTLVGQILVQTVGALRGKPACRCACARGAHNA
jgi:hypothetical protein